MQNCFCLLFHSGFFSDHQFELDHRTLSQKPYTAGKDPVGQKWVFNSIAEFLSTMIDVQNFFLQ